MSIQLDDTSSADATSSMATGVDVATTSTNSELSVMTMVIIAVGAVATVGSLIVAVVVVRRRLQSSSRSTAAPSRRGGSGGDVMTAPTAVSVAVASRSVVDGPAIISSTSPRLQKSKQARRHAAATASPAVVDVDGSHRAALPGVCAGVEEEALGSGGVSDRAPPLRVAKARKAKRTSKHHSTRPMAP